MRRVIWTGLGLGALGLALLAGVLVALEVNARLWLAGSGARTVSSRLDFSAAPQGLVGWDRVYESRLEHLDVWHAAAGLEHMQLEEGAHSTNQCLWLSHTERVLVVGSTTAVKLCPSQNGTRMYVHQTFY